MRGFWLAAGAGVGTAVVVGLGLWLFADQARLPAANDEALADLWEKEIARLSAADPILQETVSNLEADDGPPDPGIASDGVRMSANADSVADDMPAPVPVPDVVAAAEPMSQQSVVTAAPPIRVPIDAMIAAAPSAIASAEIPQTEIAAAAGQEADFAEVAPATQGLIEELRAAEDLGLLTHNIPSQMEGLEPMRLTVNLSRGEAGARVLARERVRGPRILRVNDYVLIKLDGSSDFFIESVLDDDRPQRVPNDDAGAWDFDVLPLNAGETELRIIVVLYDQTGYEPIATFSEPIRVTISVPARIRVIAARVAENGWVVSVGSGVVATAICGGWVAFRSRRRKSDDGPFTGS